MLCQQKKGLGIEIWGTRDDLEYLYDVISKFWNENLFSDEYNEFLDFLRSEAKKYNCNIEDLELSDEDELYEIE